MPMLKRSTVVRVLLVAALAVGAAGGATAAQAANSSAQHATHHHHGGFFGHGVLSTAASYLGLTNEQLKAQLKSGKTLAQVADATPGKSSAGLVDALVAAAKTKLDKLVADKRITQAQEDAFLAKYRTAAAKFVNRVAGAGHCSGHTMLVDEFGVAANYLGLTRGQLKAQLVSGKSLADLANATAGKSASGLVDAMVAAEQTKLDALVANHKLTQAQENTILAKLHDRFTALVNAHFWGHHDHR